MNIRKEIESKRFGQILWSAPDSAKRLQEQDEGMTRCFTDSNVCSFLTVGKATVVMYYNTVVATIYRDNGDYVLTRHTHWAGDCGLTACINRALHHATQGSYRYVDSRYWRQLPVVPFEDYDTDKVCVEPFTLYNMRGYRTVLAHAVLMADDDKLYRGRQLLESMDNMVRRRHEGIRVWYYWYTMKQIDKFINDVFKDTEVPSFYK